MVAVAERGPADERRGRGAAGAGDGDDHWSSGDGTDFAEALAKRDALLALV